MSEPVVPSQIRLDAHSLRGLAHPLRVRLLGLLRESGPATATSLAVRVGESSGTTSYHLRQLAAYGFIVEDDAPHASRRERWWRARHQLTVLEALPSVDPDTSALVTEYVKAIAVGHADRVTRYAEGLPAMPEDLGQAWADAGNLSDWMLELTPEETVELGNQLAAVVARHRSVTPGQPRPAGTERVVVQIQVMPTGTGAS